MVSLPPPPRPPVARRRRWGCVPDAHVQPGMTSLTAVVERLGAACGTKVVMSPLPAALPTTLAALRLAPGRRVMVMGEDSKRVSYLCHQLQRAGVAPLGHPFHNPGGVTTAAVSALSSACQRGGATAIAAVGGADTMMLAKAVSAGLGSADGSPGASPAPTMLLPVYPTAAAIHGHAHGIDAGGQPWTTTLPAHGGASQRVAILDAAQATTGEDGDAELAAARPASILTSIAIEAVSAAVDMLIVHRPSASAPTWPILPFLASHIGLGLWSATAGVGQTTPGVTPATMDLAFAATVATAACSGASPLGLTHAVAQAMAQRYHVRTDHAAAASWATIMDGTLEACLETWEGEERERLELEEDVVALMQAPLPALLSSTPRIHALTAKLDTAGATTADSITRTLAIIAAAARVMGVSIPWDAVDQDGWRRWHVQHAAALPRDHILGHDVPEEEVAALVEAVEVSPGTAAYPIATNRSQLQALVKDVMSGMGSGGGQGA